MNLMRRHTRQTSVYLSAADVARRIGRTPSRVSRYIAENVMPAPDASTAAGQSLWLADTVDAWWVDRTPGTADDDTPRWLRPIGSTRVTPELLDERIVPGRLTRGGNTHVRVYRAVDGGSPIVIIERLHSDAVNDDDELETIRSATTVDLDRTGPLWIRIRTWATTWGAEEGAQPNLELDEIWLWKNGGWEPNQPISASAIARLIGQPVPLYPADLITDAMLTKKATTPAGQPVSILDDPQGLELLLSNLQAVTALSDYPSDSALQYAAGVIATIAAQRDEVLVSQREMSYRAPERTQMPGTCRGAVTIPRTLLAYERNDIKALQLDPPPRINGPYKEGPDGQLRQVVTIDPRLIPALRRLRRRYLEDIDLAAPARAALQLVVDDLQHAYLAGDPIAAALGKPVLVRKHSFDPRHWVIPAFLHAGYDHVDRNQIPAALAYRAQQLEPDDRFGGSENENEQWWVRRDWQLEADDAPNQPALALTYETVVKASTWSSRIHPAADYTNYTLHLEWSPLRQPTPELSTLSAARLVAPPSSAAVHRPVFLYTDDATMEQLPNDGRYGPAWGVSSTDQLTPATLLWLGYDGYAIRRKHPELYESLRGKLWGSGSDELDQPVDELQKMLESASDCRRV